MLGHSKDQKSYINGVLKILFSTFPKMFPMYWKSKIKLSKIGRKCLQRDFMKAI